MKFKTLVLLGAASWMVLASHASLAQGDGPGRNRFNTVTAANTGNGLDNPDWAEEPIPPPPAFSIDRLIALDMPPHVSVKVGVDPQTIMVGGDGVVRYVIVMRNATGTTSALFEGIRCVSDEVKTYARKGSSGEWSMVTASAWKPLSDNMPSQHAKVFARQGGCQNRLAVSQQEIVAALKGASKPAAGATRN